MILHHSDYSTSTKATPREVAFVVKTMMFDYFSITRCTELPRCKWILST